MSGEPSNHNHHHHHHPSEEKGTTKGKPPSLKKPSFIIQLLGSILFYVLEFINFLTHLFTAKSSKGAQKMTQGSGNVSSFPTETLDSTSATLVIQKPSHVSFVITGASPIKPDTVDTKDPFFVSAARLVWYAIACDVKYVSLYDTHGHIKSNGKEFAEKVLWEMKKSVALLNDRYNSKDKCRISFTIVSQDKDEEVKEESFEFAFSPQKGVLDDKPISQEPVNVFNVRVYDSSDGRGDIVNLTKEIAKDSSMSPSDITQDYISSHLKGK